MTRSELRFPPRISPAQNPHSSSLPLVNCLFVGLDLDLLGLNVETQAIVDAHVLIGYPDQGEQCENVARQSANSSLKRVMPRAPTAT